MRVIAWRPDGGLLATSSGGEFVFVQSGSSPADDRVVLWEPHTGDQIAELPERPNAHVEGIAWAPDGSVLASYGGRSVRLWNPTTASAIGEPFEFHAETVRRVAFDPTGRGFVSVGDDGAAFVYASMWNVAEACELVEPYVSWGQVLVNIPDGHESQGCNLR